MKNKEQEKQPEFVAFPITLINTLLEYLSERPFKEVNSMIVSIQKEGKILSNIQSNTNEVKEEENAVEEVESEPIHTMVKE